MRGEKKKIQFAFVNDHLMVTKIAQVIVNLAGERPYELLSNLDNSPLCFGVISFFLAKRLWNEFKWEVFQAASNHRYEKKKFEWYFLSPVFTVTIQGTY